MTIDEGIKNLEYGTKQLEMELESGLWIKGSESELSCKEGIAHNKQHIEWLRELKEAKQLLKAAVEDIKDMLPHTDSCDDCALNKDDAHDCSNSTLNCDVKCKWRYADEALKLIGDNNR